MPRKSQISAAVAVPGGTASMTFGDVLRERAISVEFQPIVDLASHEIVGYEALARGPAGSRWTSPVALFDAAYQSGRAAELDWVCRAAALRASREAGIPEPTALFVNAEPATLGSACPPDLAPTIAARAVGRPRLILEVTERAVASNPAGLLAAVEQARQNSVGIALDDVGVDPASLAMMPLIRPDVIKLDLTIIQERTTRAVARIVNAVMAEAERTGAAILAEGIESLEHVQIAQAMGATLGQGWLYGRPGEPPDHPAIPSHPIDLLTVPTSDARTPYETVMGRRRLNRATASLLLPMSMHLEYQGLDATEPTVLLACFQDISRFHPSTRRRFAQLAARGVFTAVLGRDMPPEPGPGIRGARLDPADPMVSEWSVVVLGTHFAAALLARQRDDNSPGPERAFDFVITHDRETVIDAARPLLRRIVAVAA